MKKAELKPCPFCGGEAELLIDESKYYKSAVICTKCYVHTPYEHIETIAVSAWNRRVKDENT